MAAFTFVVSAILGCRELGERDSGAEDCGEPAPPGISYRFMPWYSGSVLEAEEDPEAMPERRMPVLQAVPTGAILHFTLLFHVAPEPEIHVSCV